MNEYNQKRLEKALDDLNALEEEIVPCWAEENAFLERECENEKFTKEMLMAKNRLSNLEVSLSAIKDCRKYLKFVINSNKKDLS